MMVQDVVVIRRWAQHAQRAWQLLWPLACYSCWQHSCGCDSLALELPWAEPPTRMSTSPMRARGHTAYYSPNLTLLLHIAAATAPSATT